MLALRRVPRSPGPRPSTPCTTKPSAACTGQWLSDACVDSDGGQTNLARHPQIIRANRRHRRLVRRHGLNRTTTAHRDAAWTCRRWHHDRDHDQEFVDLLTGFHGPSRNLAIIDATIQAARYPQIVALTRLLASPYWRAKAHQAKPVEFVAEVQRTIASRYIWTLAGPHRCFDPLVETLGHHLRPIDVQQGASIGQ